MEIHRLTRMREGYSQELFNKLYQETKPLRISLARQIDARRYNVTNDIIQSWFDDKFIFVFNKHFDNKQPEVLKGYIINALKTFKLRILRKAYNQEGLFHSSLVELEGESEIINYIPDRTFETTESIFRDMVVEFMKEKLSDNAYLLFELQLDPPPYIINRIPKPSSKIPYDLIIDYLGIDFGDYNSDIRYAKKLRKEIAKAIKNAREYFNNESLALS